MTQRDVSYMYPYIAATMALNASFVHKKHNFVYKLRSQCLWECVLEAHVEEDDAECYQGKQQQRHPLHHPCMLAMSRLTAGVATRQDSPSCLAASEHVLPAGQHCRASIARHRFHVGTVLIRHSVLPPRMVQNGPAKAETASSGPCLYATKTRAPPTEVSRPVSSVPSSCDTSDLSDRRCAPAAAFGKLGTCSRFDRSERHNLEFCATGSDVDG